MKSDGGIIQGSGIDSARPVDKITRDSIHWGGVGSVIHGGPRNDGANKSRRAVAKPWWMKRGRKGKEGKARVSETRIESIKTLMLGPGGGNNTSSIGCRRKGEGGVKEGKGWSKQHKEIKEVR